MNAGSGRVMPDDKKPPPVRAYTCFIDGVAHSFVFPHSGLKGVLLNAEANMRFEMWLEAIAPGARDAGRVTGIRFADMQE